MPRVCRSFQLVGPSGDVVTGIACGVLERRPCSVPGCRGAGRFLCDHPVTRAGKEATCDRACCREHSKRVGPDRDYCLPHWRAEQMPLPLPEEK